MQQRSHIELKVELLSNSTDGMRIGKTWHGTSSEEHSSTCIKKEVSEVASVYFIILCFKTTTGLGEKVMGIKTILPHPSLDCNMLS